MELDSVRMNHTCNTLQPYFQTKKKKEHFVAIFFKHQVLIKAVPSTRPISSLSAAI